MKIFRKKSNLHISIFKKGDKVLYRNHFKEFVKWIPATILQSVSKNTYLINMYVFYTQIN